MSVQIGAGGIISDIYQKYHSFDSLITLEWDSIHSGQDLYEIYQPDNIYQWINEKNGFHSEIARYESTHYLIFHFKKPFILRHFRMMMCPDFRFPRVWKMETKYKTSELKTIYKSSSDSLLCPVNENGDCSEYTETYYTLESSNIDKVDTIKISNVGEDTRGTYCFTLGAIEFYGSLIFPTHTTTFIINFLPFVFIFLLL